MALNENIMVRLMADTSNYTARMQAASQQASRLSTALEKPMTTSERVGAGMTKAGLAIGAVSTAIGVAAVKTFAEFDAAMSTVQANTGASADEMSQLRQAAIDAGSSTVYSASEAAGAINELGKAGMSTTDILSGGLSGALNLAASDGMQVSEAAELMSSAMTQFNLTGTDAGRVADALAAGAGNAQGSARDLGYALQQSGMVANSFGIGMEETVGTLSAFASAGMVGSDAGTSLKTMLISLANPSKEASALMDQLGIHAYDAQGNFVGLGNLAGQLKSQMAGLTQEQRNQALATMFGSDAIRAANVLYEQGADGIADWTAKVSDAGFAAEQAAAKNDNLKGDLENLSGSVESMLITIGEGANGPLRSIVQTVDALVDAFAGLPAPIQQGVVIAGMAVGAFAGLHKVFGGLSASTSKAGQALGLALDPVQRLSSAAPKLADGLRQLGTAATMSTGIQSLSGNASRASTAMGGLKSIAGGVVDLMGGPLGIALTVAGAALATYAQKATEARQRTQEVQTAIESASDAAQQSKNVNETLINQLQDMQVGEDKWYGAIQRYGLGLKTMPDLLKNVGLSMTDMVKAAQGSGPALDKVNATIERLRKSGGDGAVGKADNLRAALDKLKTAYSEGNAAAADKSAALDQLSGSSDGATNSLTALAGAEDSAASATQKAASASSILSGMFGATTDAISAQASALGAVTDAMSTYYGFGLSASDALISMHDAFDKATQAAQQNGQTLDLNTEAGRANQSALNDLAQSALKAADAQVRNGASMDDVNGTLNEARDRYIQAAQAMGMTPEAADAAANAAGLTSEKFQQLAQAAGAVPSDVHTNIDVTDNATNTFQNLDLQIQATPDGKHITISGDNQQAIDAIAAVNGLTVDPKTGTLTLDKAQFDVALAIANGAKVDPKTGLLRCDNNPYLKGVLEANGMKVDEKTGIITGDNSQALTAIGAVNNKAVYDKSFTITENYVKTETIIRRSKMEDLNGDASGNGRMGTMAHGGLVAFAHGGLYGYASGGYHGLVGGVGSGVSDSNMIRVSRGEYVIKARAVDHYGTATMDMINAMRWTPDEGALYQAAPPWWYLNPPSQPQEARARNVTVNLNQKVVRSDQDMYAAAAIYYRNAAAIVGRLSS